MVFLFTSATSVHLPPDALRYIRYPSSLATGFHVSFTCELDKTVGLTVVAYGRVAPVAAVYSLYTCLLFCLLYAFTAYWYGFPATSYCLYMLSQNCSLLQFSYKQLSRTRDGKSHTHLPPNTYSTESSMRYYWILQSLP